MNYERMNVFAKVNLDDGTSFVGYVRGFDMLEKGVGSAVILHITLGGKLVDVNWNHVVSIAYDIVPSISTEKVVG